MYGSLMSGVVRNALRVGLDGPVATARGFRRKKVHGESWLAMVEAEEDPDARVDGMVLQGVDEAKLSILDHFEAEGQLYLRKQIVVTAADGAELEADAYIWNGPPGLLYGEWSFAEDFAHREQDFADEISGAPPDEWP